MAPPRLCPVDTILKVGFALRAAAIIGVAITADSFMASLKPECTKQPSTLLAVPQRVVLTCRIARSVKISIGFDVIDVPWKETIINLLVLSKATYP